MSITIFDIGLIVDTICTNLTTRDFGACSQVNKSLAGISGVYVLVLLDENIEATYRKTPASIGAV
ncbi:hypothetical protein BGZ93_003934 [Podila epicladia]|nr:hypothetical protein BGZ92_011186 [Podila epicladia]KAG0096823.1 hypothetical protein BGZ93_003934 [Podila epicladia]